MATHHYWWTYVKEMIRRYPSRKDRPVLGVAACEKEAVRAAVEVTERIMDGQDRIKVIDLVLWKGTHKIPGAALQIPCSERTAQQWHADFIREVARNFKCDGLL